MKSHRSCVDRSSVRGSLRRCVVAGAFAAAIVSTVALPLQAHAAPPRALSTSDRANLDPVAIEAASALVALQRAQLGSTSSVKSVDQTLDRIAEVIGARLLVDPTRLKLAWHSADREHQSALLAAFTQLGVPYRTNTSKPGQGFDCSGLTTYAWSHAGVVLPRQSTSQIRASAPRDRFTAQAGDLVQYPGHIMMWLGVDRAVIHSPYTGRHVEVDSFSDRRKVRFGDPTG